VPWRPSGTLAAGLVPLRIVLTFLLVHVGWLLFRETDASMLARHLSLSPFADSVLDRQAALALVLMLVPFALPLFVEGLWVDWHRGGLRAAGTRPAQRLGWPTLAGQGVFVGLVLTCILLFRSRASLDFIYFQF